MSDANDALGSPDWLAMLRGIFEQTLAADGHSDFAAVHNQVARRTL